MYAGQPLPYAYAPNSQPGYISPTEPRRYIEDEKDKHSTRQSLPSIHEALGNDSLPYPTPTSAPPPQSHPAQPTHLTRPSTEGPAGPPNPFNQGMMRESGFQPPQLHDSHPSLTSINTQDSRASLHSISTNKSPTQSSKTGITSVGSQHSAYEYSAPTSAGSVASPNGYNHFPPNYSFPPAHHPHPSTPYENRPYMGARVDEVKGGFVGRPGPPHSDTVKRHLDVYDVEQSLNEVRNEPLAFLNFTPPLPTPEPVENAGFPRISQNVADNGSNLWFPKLNSTDIYLPDRRDEHTDSRLLATLCRSRAPDPAVWPNIRVPPFAE